MRWWRQWKIRRRDRRLGLVDDDTLTGYLFTNPDGEQIVVSEDLIDTVPDEYR